MTPAPIPHAVGLLGLRGHHPVPACVVRSPGGSTVQCGGQSSRTRRSRSATRIGAAVMSSSWRCWCSERSSGSRWRHFESRPRPNRAPPRQMSSRCSQIMSAGQSGSPSSEKSRFSGLPLAWGPVGGLPSLEQLWTRNSSCGSPGFVGLSQASRRGQNSPSHWLRTASWPNSSQAGRQSATPCTWTHRARCVRLLEDSLVGSERTTTEPWRIWPSVRPLWLDSGSNVDE